MPVSFYELAGSPREEFTRQKVTATREILVDWDDRQAMRQELLGAAAGGTGFYAAYPGIASLYASQVQIEPFDAVPDSATFSDIAAHINDYSGRLAKLTILYEMREANESDEVEYEPGTTLEYRRAYGVDIMLLPPSGFTWCDEAAAPVTAQDAPQIRLPIIEHQLIWKNVVTPPWTSIQGMIGKINSSTFLDAPTGTLLFDGCKAEKEFVTAFGQDAFFGWKVEFLFRQRIIPGLQTQQDTWNLQWRSLPAANPGWDELRGAGNSLYEKTSFSSLFSY